MTGQPGTFYLVVSTFAITGGAFWLFDRFGAVWWTYFVCGLAVAGVFLLAIMKDLHDVTLARHLRPGPFNREGRSGGASQ